MTEVANHQSDGRTSKFLRIGCLFASLLMGLVIVLILLAIAIPNYIAYTDKNKWRVNPTEAVRWAAVLGNLILDYTRIVGPDATVKNLTGRRETEALREISTVLPKFQLPEGHPFDYAITFVTPDLRDGVRFCITASVNHFDNGDGTSGRIYYHSKVQTSEGWIDRSSTTQFQTGKEPALTCSSMPEASQ